MSTSGGLSSLRQLHHMLFPHSMLFSDLNLLQLLGIRRELLRLGGEGDLIRQRERRSLLVAGRGS